MAIRGDSWRFAAIRGDAWRFAAIRGDSWRFVAIRGDLLISDTRHNDNASNGTTTTSHY